MGRRGPAPTPTAKLRLRGSWRGNARSGEPQPPRRRPACPAWLDRGAKAAWKELIPQLEEMGVLSIIDRNALARYCRAWSRWKAAEAFIEKHGEVYTIKHPDGSIKYIQQFPHVSMANKLAQQLTRLEQEFGMTPSARSRINVTVAAPPLPMASDKSRFFRSPA